MLTINHVTKRYGKHLANNDISLTVQDGEVAVLLGQSEAGKSTLIKCIAGLLRYKGNIAVNGFHNQSTNAKRLLGYVPQYPAVYELLTIREHMEFIAKAYSIDHWEQQAERLLHQFRLHQCQFKLGKELYSEERHKLNLCCALLHRPQVLLLDEPFQLLGTHGEQELLNLCVQLKENGTSILISARNVKPLGEIWDQAYVLQKGTLSAAEHTTKKAVDPI